MLNKFNESVVGTLAAEPLENEKAVVTKSDEENCAFCDLFMSEVEMGKAGKKDAELFSAHLDSGEHSHIIEEKR
jgi:hypothetical protein